MPRNGALDVSGELKVTGGTAAAADQVGTVTAGEYTAAQGPGGGGGGFGPRG
ncbi:hypothetical protein [Arthrobacter sp. UYCo732]|uniref:hypothetical protein n=1 Tax=Arthrobacter sp. UYCo732 TaxID=3156336 RepID=UPI00339736ED